MASGPARGPAFPLGPGTHRLCWAPRSPQPGASVSAVWVSLPPPTPPMAPAAVGGRPSLMVTRWWWGGGHQAVPSLCESVLAEGREEAPPVPPPSPAGLDAGGLTGAPSLAWCTTGAAVGGARARGVSRAESWVLGRWEGAPAGARGGGPGRAGPAVSRDVGAVDARAVEGLPCGGRGRGDGGGRVEGSRGAWGVWAPPPAPRREN